MWAWGLGLGILCLGSVFLWSVRMTLMCRPPASQPTGAAAVTVQNWKDDRGGMDGRTVRQQERAGATYLGYPVQCSQAC